MISYRGVTTEDQPIGAGWFVAENNDGGEVLNFLPVRRRMYGYARMQDNRSLNITRLGAAPDAAYLDDVTVVFFSKNPITGGQYVVGWYERARLYRASQMLNRPGHPWYTCETSAGDAHLLPLDQRTFAMPADGPGQTNAWHVMHYRSQKTFLAKFKRFQRDPAAYGKARVKKGNASGWMKDMEKRKAIEMAAMHAAELHFTKLGYKVRFVHRENLGWDMEAVMGTTSFRIEAKGTSLPLNCIDLTPNEYHHSSQHANYRICILERALEKNRARLHICVLDQANNCWRSDTGNKLAIRPITSARLELAQP